MAAEFQKINNVHPDTHTNLTNIAKNKGIFFTDFLRKELIKFSEELPELPEQKPQYTKKEIRVYALPARVSNKLLRKAASMNIDPSAYLKTILDTIQQSYPEHMKKPPLDY